MSDLTKRLRNNADKHWPGAKYIYEAADALEAKDKEIERLRERLEMYPVKLTTGEVDRDELLSESCDGIACRDETIKLLEAEIERLNKRHDDFLQEFWATNARNAKLQAVVDALECDSEWCGKSPHGTPGKRGYDDGKCQICKARAALKENEDE